MAQTLTSTRVPAGTSYPATVVCSRATRGIRSGTTGCSRMDSLTTASRYGRPGMSPSPTRRSRPTTRSSSSVTLHRTRGSRSTSDMAHSTVTDDVSVPPVTSSSTDALTPSRSSGTSRRPPGPPSPSSASCSSRSTMSPGTNAAPSRRRRSPCSRSTCSMNRSNFPASRFILPTYPCASSQPSHGTMSPTCSAPLRKKISSIIHLNSSGVAAAPGPPASSSPTYFLPSTMREITLSVTMSRRSLSTTAAVLVVLVAGCGCRSRSMARTSSARTRSVRRSWRALSSSVTHNLRS
uniref:Uncharacterized protein n=1 Tax=Zea mays TaxID=4577 RepID=A0A804RIM9_MAIZE